MLEKLCVKPNLKSKYVQIPSCDKPKKAAPFIKSSLFMVIHVISLKRAVSFMES